MRGDDVVYFVGRYFFLGGACFSTYSICLKPCDRTADCRAGYACTASIGAQTLSTKSCVPGNENAHPGDACTNSGQCQVGGYCLSEGNEGYPGGYCSLQCNPATANSCGAGSVCAGYTDGNGHRQGTCTKACDTDGMCRTGYVCDTHWAGGTLQSPACLPGTRADVAVGASCANQGGCPVGWFCLREPDGFPGGYCSRSCATGQPACPGDSFCGTDFQICLDGCAADSECRSPRYKCSATLLGAPTPHHTCAPYLPSAHVGDTCATLADCTLGGYCIPERDQNGDPTLFTGGYCSLPCQNNTQCPAQSFCQSFGSAGSGCVRSCSAAGQCRGAQGYVCQPLDMNQLGCFPNFAAGTPDGGTRDGGA